MTLSEAEFVSLVDNPEKARILFPKLGLSVFPLSQSTFKMIVRIKLFPAYQNADKSVQTEIETMLGEITQPPEVEEKKPEVREPDLKTAQGVIDNYIDSGELEIEELKKSEVDKPVLWKHRETTLLVAIVEILLTQSQYGRVNIKTLSEFLIEKSPDTQSLQMLLEETQSTDRRVLRNIVDALIVGGFKFETPVRNAMLSDILDEILSITPLVIPKITCDFREMPEWKDGTYFDAAKYCFDGNYVVAKFDTGTKLYHGSFNLGDAAVSFPLGINFYNPSGDGDTVSVEHAAESEFSIDTLLSEKTKVDISWFTGFDDALRYTDKTRQCCMQSYRVKRDCVLFLLSSDYNIYKILNDGEVDPVLKRSLEKMFSINPADKLELVNAEDPFNARLIINRNRRVVEKQRVSVFDIDKMFAKLFCKNFGHLYAGYCAPNQNARDAPNFFHSELVFCNSLLYLDRDTTDSNDLFFDPEYQCDRTSKFYMKTVCELLSQMRYYDTVNTNFHSGNLLEHSIWTLLFTESLTKKLVNVSNPYVSALNDREKRVIIAAGLLHDIGKMDPSKCVKNGMTNRYIYFAIPEHPSIGARYFEQGIPVIDSGRRIDPHNILREMIPDITSDEVEVVKTVVDLHWGFSNDVVKLYSETTVSQETLDRVVQKYAALFDRTKNPGFAALATMIVSISDVEASQPFTAGKLRDAKNRDEINAILSSGVFPFIVSKPKSYRGGNLAKIIKVSDRGIIAMNQILEKIRE